MRWSPVFFFFNDTATTEIYTLSLHDALPICDVVCYSVRPAVAMAGRVRLTRASGILQGRARRSRHGLPRRSEEHTSELQSRQYLVCRLLLEKKKTHTPSSASHPPTPNPPRPP